MDAPTFRLGGMSAIKGSQRAAGGARGLAVNHENSGRGAW